MNTNARNFVGLWILCLAGLCLGCSSISNTSSSPDTESENSDSASAAEQPGTTDPIVSGSDERDSNSPDDSKSTDSTTKDTVEPDSATISGDTATDAPDTTSEIDPYGPDCFAKAITDGPCAAASSDCKADTTCAALDACITASFDQPNAPQQQAACLAAVDNAESLARYWALQECVFCDTCNLPCAPAPTRERCQFDNGTYGKEPPYVGTRDWEKVHESSAECDGSSKDCYSECWNCALTSSACTPAVESCLGDEGCAAYYNCKEQICCNGTGDCVTGDEWENCMAQCKKDHNVKAKSIELLLDIYDCIACDVCVESCAIGESADFTMCGEASSMNTVDGVCYEHEAQQEQTACFTWAGWGGPCTEKAEVCKDNADCVALENCLLPTGCYVDMNVQRDACFSAVSTQTQQLYIDYIQCVYCDACDITCAPHAGIANCETYTGK